MQPTKNYPNLTYEEYLHAVAYMSYRIQRLIELGSIAIDQLIVKWYITKVLKRKSSDNKDVEISYCGAIQKMIADGLLSVLESAHLGKCVFRALNIHPQLCPIALCIQENVKDSANQY